MNPDEPKAEGSGGKSWLGRRQKQWAVVGSSGGSLSSSKAVGLVVGG